MPRERRPALSRVEDRVTPASCANVPALASVSRNPNASPVADVGHGSCTGSVDTVVGTRNPVARPPRWSASAAVISVRETTPGGDVLSAHDINPILICYDRSGRGRQKPCHRNSCRVGFPVAAPSCCTSGLRDAIVAALNVPMTPPPVPVYNDSEVREGGNEDRCEEGADLASAAGLVGSVRDRGGGQLKESGTRSFEVAYEEDAALDRARVARDLGIRVAIARLSGSHTAVYKHAHRPVMKSCHRHGPLAYLRGPPVTLRQGPNDDAPVESLWAEGFRGIGQVRIAGLSREEAKSRSHDITPTCRATLPTTAGASDDHGRRCHEPAPDLDRSVELLGRPPHR